MRAFQYGLNDFFLEYSLMMLPLSKIKVGSQKNCASEKLYYSEEEETILVLPFSGNCNDHENRCRESHSFQRMKDIRKQLLPPSGNFTQRSNYGRAQQVENNQDGIVHRQSH